eukprot:350897-Chlamydomonas_euryale.AAC.3
MIPASCCHAPAWYVLAAAVCRLTDRLNTTGCTRRWCGASWFGSSLSSSRALRHDRASVAWLGGTPAGGAPHHPTDLRAPSCRDRASVAWLRGTPARAAL